MTPEQMALFTSIISLLCKISEVPVLFLLLFPFILLIGPWVLAMLMARGYEKRFEAVVIMYEKNIELVKKTQELAEDQKSLLALNIQVNTELTAAIRLNQFCPINRPQK